MGKEGVEGEENLLHVKTRHRAISYSHIPQLAQIKWQSLPISLVWPESFPLRGDPGFLPQNMEDYE
jgi:hypothetical protein